MTAGLKPDVYWVRGSGVRVTASVVDKKITPEGKRRLGGACLLQDRIGDQ